MPDLLISRLFFFLLVGCCPIWLQAQHANVSCVIADEHTKAPIQDAHLFFDNTSFGAISNTKGEISLNIPTSLKEDIIVSHISYNAKVISNLNLESILATDTIYLNPNGIKLDKVLITKSRSKKWKKNFKKFKKTFLGEDKAASKCKILNPEVLRFDTKGEKFTAKAIDLLEFENEYLGYRVNFLLDQLIIEENGSSSYKGHAKFVDIASEKKLKKITKNRKKAYSNSLRHFFKHLISNTLDQGEYAIKLVRHTNGNFVEIGTPNAEQLITYDSLKNHYSLKFNQFLEVEHLGLTEFATTKSKVTAGRTERSRFDTRDQSTRTRASHPKSYLYKISPELNIDKDGNLLNAETVQEYGFWANQRMATKLPLDYGVEYDDFVLSESMPKQKQTDDYNTLRLVQDLMGNDILAHPKALNKIRSQWKSNYAPPLIDILRVVQNPYLEREIKAILKKETGINNYYDGIQWLWKNEPIYDSLYANTKAEIYKVIDPKFERYFKNRQFKSKIGLDEVVWGGVVQDGIPPLRNPEMLEAKDANYLSDTDIIFGMSINGDHRAYPKRILAWHEFFVDQIGGKQIAGVYCTLCGTIIPYDMTHNGTFYDLGTSGFLYRSNKLMYDRSTQSLWSTIEGTPVIGTLVDQNIRLNVYPVVTTTWGEWKKRHPDTQVLSMYTGFNRNYDEGEAYRDYFATDRLMFPVPRSDDRLKNKDEVLIIRAEGYREDPLAISINYLKTQKVITETIHGKSFVVLTEKDGQSRVYEINNQQFKSYKDGVLIDTNGYMWTVGEAYIQNPKGVQLNRVPSHNAFWFAWYNAYPQTRLLH